MYCGNLINHCSIKWVRFKDSVHYLYQAGAVVSYCLLILEVEGLNYLFYIYPITEFSEFNGKV